MSCCMVCMNSAFFEDLVASSVFDRLPEETQQLIHSFMSTLVETASVGGSIASEGATPKVVSMEVPIAVPKLARSPRPKPTSASEVPKLTKDKQRKTLSVCESPRKHQRK